MARKNNIAARMTITFRGSSRKTIVEVRSEASFQKFYSWFSQEGRKRKKFMRTSHRGDGITPNRQAFEAPSLDALGESLERRLKDIESVTIKVLKKREYKRLCTCAPNELGEGLPQIASVEPVVTAEKLAHELKLRREKPSKGFYFNSRRREFDTVFPPEREVHVYLGFCQECGSKHSFAHFPDGSEKCTVGYEQMRKNPAFEYIGYLPKDHTFKFRYRLPAPQESVYAGVMEGVQS